MSVKMTCAPRNHINSWHDIDWKKAHRMVRKLQMRIAKATKTGKYNKVKSLQWILTHSFSAKVIAVKRVTENKGKSTPGIDGVTWSSPTKKFAAAKELKRRGYRPLPSRRIYIPKKNGKRRPLNIPTMKNRGMEALYLQALEPVSETCADNNSYGFRRERSTADAIEYCFHNLSRKNTPEWVIECDIKGCFDNISHEWLLENIPIDRVIVKKWLKAGYMEKGKLFPTISGTAQGGIISPTLANMALDGLEKVLRRKFPVYTGKKVNLVRYADDLIITGKTKTILEKEVKPSIEDFLKERGLELSKEKTRITHIDEGFDFLGQNIRKYKGKLLIKPSKKNFKAIAKKIREIIANHKTVEQPCLIRLLNPLIRGWCNYHSGIVAKEAYAKLNTVVWDKIWQWCCRRHPGKGKRWIKDKYFKQLGSRKWVFQARTGETLLKATDTPIIRHTKIRGKYNPFDPEWEVYSEERTGKLMQKKFKKAKRLLKIWKNQRSRCPGCGERITTETGWNLHHIIRRVDGGTEVLSNLTLLHPNCHRQLHYGNNVVGSQMRD